MGPGSVLRFQDCVLQHYDLTDAVNPAGSKHEVVNSLFGFGNACAVRPSPPPLQACAQPAVFGCVAWHFGVELRRDMARARDVCYCRHTDISEPALCGLQHDELSATQGDPGDPEGAEAVCVVGGGAACMSACVFRTVRVHAEAVFSLFRPKSHALCPIPMRPQSAPLTK